MLSDVAPIYTLHKVEIFSISELSPRRLLRIHLFVSTMKNVHFGEVPCEGYALAYVSTHFAVGCKSSGHMSIRGYAA